MDRSSHADRMATTDRLVLITTDCHAAPRRLADFRPFVSASLQSRFDALLEQQPASEGDIVREKLGKLSAFVDRGLIDGQLAGAFSGEGDVAGTWDSEQRRRQFEAEGIVGEVIYPDNMWGALPAEAIIAAMDFELLLEGIRAYNRWLAEFCAKLPGRRAGVAIVPWFNMEETLREIRWAKDAGLVGGILLPRMEDYPKGLGFPGLHSAYYEPMWTLCEELGMPVNDHGGSASVTPELYGDDAVTARALGSFEAILGCRRSLLFLILGGVFERHPGLKFVSTEQGADWLPGFLRELDSYSQEFEHSLLRSKLPLLPSQYWRRQCFLSGPLSRFETDHREAIGVGNLMWGNDFPHLEGVHPYTRQHLQYAFGGLPPQDVAAMLGGNAMALYGFDRQVLLAAAEHVGPTIAALSAPVALDAISPHYIGYGFRHRWWTPSNVGAAALV